jgi:hypothetical protein
MIAKTNWEPTIADIEWQKTLIETMRDNSTWAVPISRSVFQINKSSKTFKLLTGDPNNETNRRIAVVFKKLEYSEACDAANKSLNRIRNFLNP